MFKWKFIPIFFLQMSKKNLSITIPKTWYFYKKSFPFSEESLFYTSVLKSINFLIKDQSVSG